MRETAERRLQQITIDSAGGVLSASDMRELERLRLRIKQNKTDMDDLVCRGAGVGADSRRRCSLPTRLR